jgi:hypothetical protein
MYQFRDYSFYYERLYSKDHPLQEIVKSAAFDFSGKDIAKLRKNMGALLDRLSTLYLDSISNKKSTEPMISAADPTVATEPMSSAVSSTLSTHQILTTETITSGADGTVPTDSNALTTEPVISAPATTSLTTDKSIVGAMREQFYRIFGVLYNKIVEGGTNTITKSRYDTIVQNLRQCRAGGIKKTQDMKNNLKRYALWLPKSQIRNCLEECL